LSKAAEPTGSLSVALGHAQRLLERDARLAAAQAAEILKVAPGHPHAQLILGAALRIAGQTQAALELLEPLAREQPRAAAVHLELGAAFGEAGRASARRRARDARAVPEISSSQGARLSVDRRWSERRARCLHA